MDLIVKDILQLELSVFYYFPVIGVVILVLLAGHM